LNFFGVGQHLSYGICYDNIMKNKKYLVLVGFGNAFALCQTHEFSVDRKEGGLSKAIEFAKEHGSNVHVQNVDGTVESAPVWKNPIFK